jgi:DNA-directed DNA polymerase III PolC
VPKHHLVKVSSMSKKLTKKLPRLAGFIELMGRSNFSFLQGASHPFEMVEEAIRHGYQGIGICDLNGLYGVVRGYQTAKAPSLFTASVTATQKFTYLVGSELTLSDGSSITLMPMTLKGYQNLCQLLTLGKRNVAKYFSKITLQELFTYHQDLLAFPLPPITEERFLELKAVFKDRLYLPVWRDLTWESLDLSKKYFEWENTHQAQLFVTQRPYMHNPGRKPLFDLLTCIHHHTTFEKADSILIQNAERHLRPLSELAWLWRDRLDLCEQTLDIASRVDFSLDQIRYRYPSSKLPSGKTPTDQLRDLTEQGLKWRYPQGEPAKVRATIEKELSIIKKLEYEDYFLTLYEICQFAREQNILFQGRGSAANSAVCFCLGLTSVNPNEIELLFERFISVERAEPPDIDIDFEHERREEVIQHIYKTYDAEHAGMVCTVIRYKTRMSIRETAKALGMKLPKINAMIKFMGRDGFRRLVETPEVWKKFDVEEWQWTALLNLAQQIHGFPRHIGIHTGGFLITQDPITHFVPVEKATMQDRYVIQWNKDDVNDLGLMKIDVLSLGMLTALRKCFDLLKTVKGIDMNLAQVPADDVPTYDMICKADTVGVFQIESRAQMNTLPRMRPRKFYDLVVEVAIVRPGPLQGGMVHPYLRRRAGLEKTVYPHPSLEKALQRTLGVPIFQEQVMQMVVMGAKFTGGEADELRRVMSAAWRKKGTMEGIRQRILAGMHSNGFTIEAAEQVYKTIEGFASYGFPESHAASFALLTYASCFMKRHHPDVFVCALLNSQPMGFYPPRVLVQEAQRNGVEFLPIDIQSSKVEYNLVKENKVRVGFQSLYGLPKLWQEKIVQERQARGEFKSLQDLIQRLAQIPKAALLKLAASGAFQNFGVEPRQLLWQIESLSLDAQSFLWGLPKESFHDTESEETELPFESGWDQMSREYQAMGYSVGSHPMGVLRTSLTLRNEFLKKRGHMPYTHAQELKNRHHGDKVRLAGLVGITQRPPTAKGMCFITMEDEFGFMNIVLDPEVYQKDRITIYSKSLLEIWGRVERAGVIINVKAVRALPLVLDPGMNHRDLHLTTPGFWGP